MCLVSCYPILHVLSWHHAICCVWLCRICFLSSHIFACACACCKTNQHTRTHSYAQNRLYAISITRYVWLMYMCVFTLIYIYILRIHSLLIPKHYVRFVWYVHVVFYCLFVYSWFYLCFSECVFRHLMCIQLSHHRHWDVKIHNVCILAMIASPFSYVYCILHKL